MMGFDVWSESASAEEYLKGCYESEKYKKGQFKVLEDGDMLLSSLIFYQLSHGWFGIGSIATPAELRKQGWAAKLTLDVAEQLETEMGARAIFLFADINPKFYEKLGFVPLPDTFQNYKSSICMVRASNVEKIWGTEGFQPRVSINNPNNYYLCDQALQRSRKMENLPLKFLLETKARE